MCEHIKTKNIKAKKPVASLVFEYKTKECIDCGAVLWSQENQKEFNNWLKLAKKEHANLFMIQNVMIPENLFEIAKNVAEEILAPDSLVFKTLINAYYVNKSLISTNDFKECGGKKVRVKFRLSPLVYIRLEAESKAFGLEMKDTAGIILVQMLLLSCKNNAASKQVAAIVRSAA